LQQTVGFHVTPCPQKALRTLLCLNAWVFEDRSRLRDQDCALTCETSSANTLETVRPEVEQVRLAFA